MDFLLPSRMLKVMVKLALQIASIYKPQNDLISRRNVMAGVGTSPLAASAQRKIVQDLEGAPLPDFSDLRLNEFARIASRLRTDPAGMKRLRACFIAATADWNAHRATFAFISDLSKGEWVPEGLPLSDDTVGRFCRSSGFNPQHRNLLLLLFALRLMRANNHPALRDPVAAALLTTIPELDQLDAVLERSGASDNRVRIRRLSRMADGVYGFLSEGVGIIRRDLDEVVNLPLFEGLEPCSTDQSLGNLRLCAIRLSPRRGEYVASTAKVSLLHEIHENAFGELGEQGRAYIYLETETQEEEIIVVRSHGVLVPRFGSVYLLQYHLDGAGLNITFISAAELRETVSGFTKGLILTFDRVQHSGGLASRIALLRLREGEKGLSGNVTRRELVEWFGLRSRDELSVLSRLTSYLREESEVGIKPLEVPGIKSILSTWGEIKRYARKIPASASDEPITAYNYYPWTSS